VTITYRVPEDAELEAFMLPVWRGFGEPEPDKDSIADERMLWERERSIGALDGDEWVGGTGTFTMDLTLPGGATVPAGGVTMVGVAATHRRRGILTELMVRQLDDIAARGEPVAILTASESVIYGRFGYGLATRGIRRRLDVARSRFRPEVAAAGGRFRQVTIDTARALLPDAYERIRSGRPGSVARSHAWWETHVFLDRPARRDGGGGLAVLFHEDPSGEVDGWALHRENNSWLDRIPSSSLRVEELTAVDDAVHLGLWRALLDHDLYAEVDYFQGPLDDPVQWALADPRRLRSSTITDWLWVRVLDVPAALGPRHWGSPGTVVIEVVDRFRPASGGRFRIEADGTGAGSVTATDAPADLTFGAEELGACSLGGVRPSVLARVGRVQTDTPGALRTADAMFRSEVAPYCVTMF